MYVVIRFIGLILFYQATAQGPQHAIIPQWQPNDKFCDFAIMEHRPWIRVSTKYGGVADDSKWPKYKDCNTGVDCVVYRIPDGSTLMIEPGFVPTTTTNEEIPCLVPDFRSEQLVADPQLHPDALTSRSAVDYVLPPGHLTASQFLNDNIYTQLTLPPPTKGTTAKIRVVATPRNGGKPKILVLKPGTTVDIVSAPPTHVVMDYNTILHDPDATDASMKGHFFFLHKLLNAPDSPQNCKPIPDEAPANCGNQVRVHDKKVNVKQTLGVGCGNGRISPK
jgi:hypothetical protein